MPSVPYASVEVRKEPTLPDTSGIYFIWSGDRCVYVGRSVSLSQRVTLSHEKINRGERVSWIERPLAELSLDECFYIWLLAPDRNYESNTVTPSRRINAADFTEKYGRFVGCNDKTDPCS